MNLGSSAYSAMIAETWWLIIDSGSKTCAVTACYADRLAPAGIGMHAKTELHGELVNSFYSLQVDGGEVLRWWTTKWCLKHSYADCGGIPASGLIPLPPTPIPLVKGRNNMWERPKRWEGVMSPELQCTWVVKLSVAYMEPELRASIHFI